MEEYNDWYENHNDKYTINHVGSAGKMDIDAVTEMQSEKIHGVIYTT